MLHSPDRLLRLGLSVFQLRVDEDGKPAARMLIERCVDASSRSPGSFMDVLRVWAVAFSEEEWGAAVDAMCTSHLQGAAGSYEDIVEPLPPPAPLEGVEEQPRTYRRVSQASGQLGKDATAHGKLRLYLPRSPVKDEFTVLRFYSVDGALVRWINSCMLRGVTGETPLLRHEPVPVPFRIAPNEAEIASFPDDKPLVVLSRSGTGKSTTLVARMWRLYRDFWDRDPALTRGKACCIMFVTRSPTLRESIFRMLWAHAQSIGASELRDDGTLLYPFQLPDGGFAAKPFVPPTLLRSDIHAQHWPLFLTLADVISTLNATLDRLSPDTQALAPHPTLAADDREWGVLQSLDQLQSQAVDSAAAPSQATPGGRGGRAARSSAVASPLVTFDVFAAAYWPKLEHIARPRGGPKVVQDAKLSAATVWLEIKSVIKGSFATVLKAARGPPSVPAHSSGPRAEIALEHREVEFPALTLREYLDNKPATLSQDVRRVIYDCFVQYTALLQERDARDEMDAVLSLHTRLSAEGGFRALYPDVVPISNISLDECQDATLAEMLLLLRISHSPSSLFLTGDTAQAISRGVAFKFETTTAMIYDLKDERVRNDLHLNHPVDKARTHVLTQNYRGHSGLLNPAAAVLFALRHLFPDSIDRLPRDRGIFTGDKPFLLLSQRYEALRGFLGGSQHAVGVTQQGREDVITLGARQAVLVRSDAARRSLPPFLRRAGNLVITIPESKGLEFDDVVLFNFWSDSVAQKEWMALENYLEDVQRARETSSSQDIPVDEYTNIFPTEVAVSGGIVSRPLSEDFTADSIRLLEGELKQLYVALTRSKKRTAVFDSGFPTLSAAVASAVAAGAGTDATSASSVADPPRNAAFCFFMRQGLVNPIDEGDCLLDREGKSVTHEDVTAFAQPSTAEETLRASLDMREELLRGAERAPGALRVVADRLAAIGRAAEQHELLGIIAEWQLGAPQPPAAPAASAGVEREDPAVALRLVIAREFTAAASAANSRSRLALGLQELTRRALSHLQAAEQLVGRSEAASKPNDAAPASSAAALLQQQLSQAKASMQALRGVLPASSST